LLYDAVMRAYPDSKGFFMKARFFGAAVLFPAVYFGMRLFGMQGAVAGVVLVVFLDHAINFFKALRLVGMTRNDLKLFADIGKIAGAALIGGIAAEGLRRLTAGGNAFLALMVLGTLFCGVYLAALFMFGVPRTEETGRIRRMLHQARLALKLA
jgi:hypothetical protein